MRVLLVKMSSMGDIVHLFPALSDVLIHHPEICVDWVVESPFSELAMLHPGVKRVLPISLRSWRKKPYSLNNLRACRQFIRTLRETTYDKVIDVQGLIKSALIGKLAKGTLLGMSHPREKGATFLYNQQLLVSPHHHAIWVLRKCFAQAFDYELNDLPLNYAIQKTLLMPRMVPDSYFVFLHGTTWPTKHMPLSRWQHVATTFANANKQIVLPWSNTAEKARAEAIVDYCQKQQTSPIPIILPKMSLLSIISVLSHADGVVAVDTGLGHVASALGVPTVSIYGSTSCKKTGTVGERSVNVSSAMACAPCLHRHCLRGFEDNYPCYQHVDADKLLDTLNALSKRKHAA